MRGSIFINYGPALMNVYIPEDLRSSSLAILILLKFLTSYRVSCVYCTTPFFLLRWPSILKAFETADSCCYLYLLAMPAILFRGKGRQHKFTRSLGFGPVSPAARSLTHSLYIWLLVTTPGIPRPSSFPPLVKLPESVANPSLASIFG